MVPYIKPPGVKNLIVSLLQEEKRAKKRPAVRRGCLWVHRARAERLCSLCAPSAATLEGTGVAMTVITMLAVITGFDASTERKRAGRKSDPAPRNRLRTSLIPAKANLNGPRVLE
jgi:hypothetical protein